jgi:hypothetical protein
MNVRMRLLMLLTVPALAAFGQDSRPTGGGGVIGGSGTVGGGPIAHRAVTGAPYSAELVNERVQTLANGTHINHPSTTDKVYRDSEGRTRTEHLMPRPPGFKQPDGAEAPVMVTIFDPVAHVMYTLNASEKVAYKQTIQVPANRPSRSFTSSAALGVTRVFSNSGPQSAARATTDAERPQSTTEKLGTQTMEGVTVEGMRDTTVWPVGSRGNDQPVTVVNEFWTSPDLHVVVLSKQTDPIIGDSTLKLTNITRGEPDPALFQPPADYAVKENGEAYGLPH